MQKKRFLLLLKLVVSFGLLGGLLYLIDVGSLIGRLRNVDVRLLVFAYLILIAQVAISALKWHVILRSDGHNESFIQLFRTYIIGNFLSLFLPSSFGGDVYRVAALRKRVRVAASAASVIFDRLSGLFALLTIAAVGFSMIATSLYTWLFAAVYVAGIAGFLIISSNRAVGLLSDSKSRIVKALRSALVSFRQYRSDHRALFFVIALSLLFQFNVILINSFYTQALDLPIPFVTLLVVIPLAYLTEILPISINGIGVRDGALVLLLSVFGFPGDFGVALGLLIIVGRYLIGLLGGVILLGSILHQNLSAIAADDKGA